MQSARELDAPVVLIGHVRLVEGHRLLVGRHVLLAPELVLDVGDVELAVARDDGLEARVGVHVIEVLQDEAELELGLHDDLVRLGGARVEFLQQPRVLLGGLALLREEVLRLGALEHQHEHRLQIADRLERR